VAELAVRQSVVDDPANASLSQEGAREKSDAAARRPSAGATEEESVVVESVVVESVAVEVEVVGAAASPALSHAAAST